MNKDEWIEAFEALEIELGREPTEDEIVDYISGRHSAAYDMYEDDLRIISEDDLIGDEEQ